MSLTTLLTAAFVAGAIASPNVIHEERTSLLRLPRERVDENAIIPIRIALKQSNLDGGYDRLMDISHPHSPNYGKHLTADEVHDLFAPVKETVSTVENWLLDSGVNASDILHYQNKGWLAIDMPAGEAERLFATKYYEHHGPDDIKIGCDAYSLPAHVSPHVDFIKPGVKLSAPVKKRSLLKRNWRHGPGGPGYPGPPYIHHYPFPYQQPPNVGQLPPNLRNCDVNITPSCIFALYDIPFYQQQRQIDPINTMGLFESEDAFSVGDISLFFENEAPWVPSNTVPNVISVDGGTAPVSPADPRNGGESDIDIDLATSIIYPQKVVVYQVDDNNYALEVPGLLNTFLDAVDGSYCNYSAYGITGDSPGIDPTYPDPAPGGFTGARECGTYNLTRVLSVSYGGAEIDLPKPYVERQCNEFMKLGLQGHSVFVASGDYGVASFPGSDNDTYGCYSANGQNGTIYNPDYPSGCPYLTAVGGTQLNPGETVYDPESAMQVNLTAFNIATGVGPVDPALQFFASGGGFSNYFTPPSYQADAVSNYLANHSPDVPSYVANADATNVGENGGVYNRAGRGYPDVAANGAFLLTYVNLTQATYFGTSLASPIFGSVITRINEERTAAGKGPVGFVNPTLYAHPEVLNDIVTGSNPNCFSSGFNTSQGWDPVTGLGTPNYPKMLNLFLSLP